MPDLNKRVSNHRKKLQKIWNSKEWKDKKKAFINGRGCSWCGSMEYLTVHHPWRNSYGDMYLDFYLSQCKILCRRCHSALHAGKVLCKCGKSYHPFDTEECFTCYSEKYPEVKERVRLSKEKLKESQKAYRKKKYQEQKKKIDQWKKDHPPIRKKGINTNKTK